jgi:hypothetical protein
MKDEITMMVGRDTHQALLQHMGDVDSERLKLQARVDRLSRMFSLTDYQETVLEDLLIEDETLADENSNHLLIAANVAFADTKQIEQGDLRAYIAGSSVVIETRVDGEWSKSRTLPMETAMILGHARAKARLEEIEDVVDMEDESAPEPPTFHGHIHGAGTAATAITSGKLDDHSISGEEVTSVSLDFTADEDKQDAIDAVRMALAGNTK